MTSAGDIAKEYDLHVIQNVASSDADTHAISRGDIVCWDKSNNDGFMQATNSTTGPFGVALDDADAAGDSIRVLDSGVVWVGKVTGQALHAKEYVEVSSTAGKVTIFDYSSGTFKDVVGTVVKDAAANDTVVLIKLGM